MQKVRIEDRFYSSGVPANSHTMDSRNAAYHPQECKDLPLHSLAKSSAHAILDVEIYDKVQLFICETIVFG